MSPAMVETGARLPSLTLKFAVEEIANAQEYDEGSPESPRITPAWFNHLVYQIA